MRRTIMTPSLIGLWVSVLLFAGMLLLSEAGHRIGRRRLARYPESSHAGIGAVGAAILGLLGLALAFTFDDSSDRLLLRRAQIVDEANAIGTAYLRLDLLPPSEQPAVRDLFGRYLERRIGAFDQFQNEPASKTELDRAAELQREIWARCVATCRNAPDPASLLLLPALNNMFDLANTRTIAATIHAPLIVIVLLIALALLGALLIGYAMSLQPRRNLFYNVLFALAIAVTVFVVLDLEYPRSGLITLRATDRAMLELRETIRR